MCWFCKHQRLCLGPRYPLDISLVPRPFWGGGGGGGGRDRGRQSISPLQKRNAEGSGNQTKIDFHKYTANPCKPELVLTISMCMFLVASLPCRPPHAHARPQYPSLITWTLHLQSPDSIIMHATHKFPALKNTQQINKKQYHACMLLSLLARSNFSDA